MTAWKYCNFVDNTSLILQGLSLCLSISLGLKVELLWEVSHIDECYLTVASYTSISFDGQVWLYLFRSPPDGMFFQKLIFQFWHPQEYLVLFVLACIVFMLYVLLSSPLIVATSRPSAKPLRRLRIKTSPISSHRSFEFSSEACRVSHLVPISLVFGPRASDASTPRDHPGGNCILSIIYSN